VSITVLPSPEQRELRDSVRRLLGTPSDAIDRLSSGPEARRRVWDGLSQIGFFGVLAPAEFGGFDGSLADIVWSLIEFGRAMPPSPVIPSLIAVQALGQSSDTAVKAQWLTPLIEGERAGAVVVPGACLSGGDGPPRIEATGDDDGWLLSGFSGPALFADAADTLVVEARRPDGVPALFAVDTHQVAVTRLAVPVLDGSRTFATVTFDHAAGTLVATGEQGLRRIDELGAFLLAVEATGGARRCLDMCLEYVRVREQFGRPIGTFQALRHRLSDLFVEVEASESLVGYGAAVHGEDPHAFTEVTMMAKSHCVDTLTLAADEAIQIQGGIGFTWENEAHHHLKRAKTADKLFGCASVQRDRLSRNLLGETEIPA
jgi:alkylation response protein AidB-like acyl-CoA dehydrogenase